MSASRSSRSDETAGGDIVAGEGWAARRGEGVAMGARAESDPTRTSPDSHDESAPFLEGPFENLYRTFTAASTLTRTFGQQTYTLTGLPHCHPVSPLAVEPVLVLVRAETVQAQQPRRVWGSTFLTVQGLGTRCEGLGMQRVGSGGHHLLQRPSGPAAS